MSFDQEIRMIERRIASGEDTPELVERLGEQLARAGQEKKFLEVYARVVQIGHDLELRCSDLRDDPSERLSVANVWDEWLYVLANFERLREDAGWPEPSMRSNSLDEDLRRLERAASTGDQDAQRRLELARARLAPSPAPMDAALAQRLKAIAWDRSDRGLEPKAQKLTGAIAKDVVFAYFIGQGWKRDERAGYNYQDNLLSPNEQQKVQFEKTVTHFFKGGRGKWVKDHRQPDGSTIKLAEMLLGEAYRILGEGEQIGKIRERQERQRDRAAAQARKRQIDRLRARIVNVEMSKLASVQERHQGLATGIPPRIDVSNAIDPDQALVEATDLYERLGALDAEREIDRRFTLVHPPILFKHAVNVEYLFGNIRISYDASLDFWEVAIGGLRATLSASTMTQVVSVRSFSDGTGDEQETFHQLLAAYDIHLARANPG